MCVGKYASKKPWEERIADLKIILREIFKTGTSAGTKQFRRDMVVDLM